MYGNEVRLESTERPLFRYNLCHPNHRVHLKDGIWSHPLAQAWEMKVKYKPKLWFRLKDFIQQLHFNHLWGPLDFIACSLLTVVTFGLFIEHFHFLQNHFWPEIVLKCGMPVYGCFKGKVHQKMKKRKCYNLLALMSFQTCTSSFHMWSAHFFNLLFIQWQSMVFSLVWDKISSFVLFIRKQVKEI